VDQLIDLKQAKIKPFQTHSSLAPNTDTGSTINDALEAVPCKKYVFSYTSPNPEYPKIPKADLIILN